MKYYIKIWIAETVLHFVNGRCCLLLYTIGKTQKTNNQGSEKVKVSWRHCLPSWFFKTRLFPKVRKFIFWKLATKVTVSYMRFFGVQTGRQTDKLSVCLLLACVLDCVIMPNFESTFIKLNGSSAGYSSGVPRTRNWKLFFI